MNQPAVSGPVVLVSHSADFGGGAEMVFAEMLRALAEAPRFAPLLVVVPAYGDISAVAEELGMRVVLGKVPRWADFTEWGRRDRLRQVAKTLSAATGALLLFRQERPRLVVSNTMVAPSHALAARVLGVPHVWFVHEFGDLDHKLSFVLPYARTVKLIGGLSARVVCCSEAVAAHLQNFASGIKTVVVPYGFAPIDALSADRQPDEPLRLLFVGRFTDEKGQLVALDAFAEAVARGAHALLTMVGPGLQDAVRDRGTELGVADRLTLVGPTRQLGGLRSRAHVALMTSSAEAFGRVTVEAMQAGLPVLGTAAGGTVEIVSDGVNGLLSQPGDVAGLTQNMLRLAADEGLRRELSRGALSTAEAFNPGRYGAALAQVVDDALTRPPRHRL